MRARLPGPPKSCRARPAVEVNRGNSAAGSTVLDLAATAITVNVGGGNDVVFDFAGADGTLLRAAGNVTLTVDDFFHVHGGLAFERSSETIRLSDGTSVDTNLLTIGASNGLTAFVGVNGPADQADALGISLSDVNFALALFRPVDSADTRPWTSLVAAVGNAAFVGVDNLTLSVSSLEVAINSGSGAGNNTVADFTANPLAVKTGPGGASSCALSADGERFGGPWL